MAKKPLPRRALRLGDNRMRVIDIVVRPRGVKVRRERQVAVVRLVEHSEQDLGLSFGGLRARVDGKALLERGQRQRRVCVPVPREQAQHGRAGCEVLH